MSRPRSPPRESDGAEKRRRSGWKEGDRDELGEMREGMNPGVLVSQDFRTVNRHFTSAVEKVLKKQMKVTPYCEEIMRRARLSEGLAVKKLLFLTSLCMFPEIREYYANTCDPRKFDPWFASLEASLDTFLTGRHRDETSKCVRKTDAKYRSVASFVGAVAARYVNL